MSLSRRSVLVGGATVSMTATLGACGREPGVDERSPAMDASTAEVRRGRLAFRPPEQPRAATGRTGTFAMSGGGGAPPAELHVPALDGREPLRLVVMLHGAGGVARSALDRLRGAADAHRLLVLAPKSTSTTWDVIGGGYGPDVRNLDRLLAEVAAAYPLRGFTIGGFSDGASYALSLGIGNGDVFDSVIAFSPGFQAAGTMNGRPEFFVSHGTADRVLPIDRCSRRIVPALEEAGYDVTYHEFDGGHVVPEPVRDEAVAWLDAR
ncbi:alpha/beta hydrolase [Nocardioides xinjiangensis]|uniref:alpha/beta hydrolase n=1 Tax=Nocardioides xinjiangensis TaxID=2817376 RepID=UPI001B311A5A|nr:phospholipase [Nocardioides sp. SYSU D00514]